MKPILQALVLADHVYRDGQTGKFVIAGTFNALLSARFPTQLGRATFAYVCLTEVEGEIGIGLRYVNLKDNGVLLEMAPIPVKAGSRLDSVELVFQVPPFPMPQAGAFAFELVVDGEPIAVKRITVGETK